MRTVQPTCAASAVGRDRKGLTSTTRSIKLTNLLGRNRSIIQYEHLAKSKANENYFVAVHKTILLSITYSKVSCNAHNIGK